MAIVVIVGVLLLIVGINIFLWKSGFLFDAERLRPLIDKPVKNPKERKAAIQRIQRWRTEGRITREELERWTALCEQNWDT